MLAFSTPLQAQSENKPYFTFCGGVSFNDITNIKQLAGAPVSGVSASWEPGTRFDFALGARYLDSVDLELETGLLWNSMERFNGAVVGPGHIDLYQTPILMNIVYRPDRPGKLKPYLGLGAGGVVANLDANVAGVKDGNSMNFAYQLLAGARYPVNERTEVGVGYKLLGTTDQKFGNSLKIESPLNHGILFTLTFKF
jgi:opacity protein-like surface antigen